MNIYKKGEEEVNRGISYISDEWGSPLELHLPVSVQTVKILGAPHTFLA